MKRNASRFFGLVMRVIAITFILSLYCAGIVYALEDEIFGNEIIFTQDTSNADGTEKKVTDGIPIPNWFNWFTLESDGFNELYEALKADNTQLYIKYKGDYILSASFTHWGSVSAVSCTSVKESGGYKYAIFDEEAIKSLFTKYNENSGNLNEDGTIKPAMALSLDGRDSESKCNMIYGLYVVNTGYVSPESKVTVYIDMGKTYQSIDGFGASYTWYSDWLSNANCAELGYDWIFNDAQFNILRFRDQHGLAGNEKNEPIDGYKNYKAYYDAAISRGIDPIVMVTSWGQYDRELPFVEYTEKSENGFCYYTLAKDENGEYMYDELAKFCVQSIQYFFDAGIPVHYFSISNEIELQERHTDENGNARDEAGFFYGMDETKDHCAYWKAHLAVYNAFKEAFGEKAPSIIGAETMAGENKYLQGYLNELMDNYADTFDVVAHHLYGTALSTSNFESIYNNFSDYRLWQTEWYNNDYFELGDVILNELISENISAFLYWNGVWPYDEGNCLLEISTWESSAELKRMPGHYIMMHFSKFIKNGYKRVDVSENLKSKVGAFKSLDDSKLVVVVSNNTDREDELNIPLEYKVLSSKVYQSIESNQTYMTELGEFSDGMKIPAKSLTTIVFKIETGKEEVETTENSTGKIYSEEETEKSTNIFIYLGITVTTIIVIGGICIVTDEKRKKVCK